MTMLKTWIRKVCMVLMAGLICVLLLLPNFSADASGTTGTVKYRVLNVRKEASTSSNIVCKLSKGTKVSIVSEKTGTDGLKWYSVSFTYNGGTYKGYIRSDLLTAQKPANIAAIEQPGTNNGTSQNVPASQNGDTLYVSASAVRVREEPSESAAIIANLLKGDEVRQKSVKTGTDGKK